MPPFDNAMDNHNLHLEASNSHVFSSLIQPTLTKDDQTTIPQLSFDGLLQQDTNLASCKLPFVWKLYEMLEGVENSGDEHIVSWVESGRAFRVHQLEEFVKDIVPIYFKQSKYKSFQRQLNFYGFTRITSGPNAGAYYHAEFLKGQKTMCLKIRPKSSSTTTKKKSSAKKNMKSSKSTKSEEHWMPQIQSLLKHGADHGLKQQDSQVMPTPLPQQQPRLYHQEPLPQQQQQQRPEEYISSVAVARIPAAAQWQETEDDEDDDSFLQDGDAVTIFGNMSFHFVGNKR